MRIRYYTRSTSRAWRHRPGCQVPSAYTTELPGLQRLDTPLPPWPVVLLGLDSLYRYPLPRSSGTTSCWATASYRLPGFHLLIAKRLRKHRSPRPQPLPPTSSLFFSPSPSPVQPSSTRGLVQNTIATCLVLPASHRVELSLRPPCFFGPLAQRNRAPLAICSPAIPASSLHYSTQAAVEPCTPRSCALARAPRNININYWHCCATTTVQSPLWTLSSAESATRN